jgi:hypothetical protein
MRWAPSDGRVEQGTSFVEEGASVISERSARLFEEHPPEAQTGSPTPTLAELFHEVEVAAKFGISRDELARQLGLHDDLFDALVEDVGVRLD